MARKRDGRSKEDKKNAFVTDWFDKIDQAQEYRKKYTSINRWPDYRKMYRGQWADGILPINRSFSFGRSLLPQVYFKAPRVTVTATRPEFVWHARVVEAIDNYLIQELNTKWTLKTGSTHCYIAGYGPIKIGYDSEYGYVPQQAIGPDRSSATQVGESDDRKIEYKDYVKPGLPWALPTLPEDVIFPYGYQSFNEMPWIAHRIYRSLEDVQQDSKYQNTEKLQGSKEVWFQPRRRSGFPGDNKKPPGNICELFEVRDKRTGMLYTFCEDQLLLGIPDDLQIEELPWEFIVFNNDPEFPWGVSDMAILEPQQLELNEINTQIQQHRKIALVKFLYRSGALSEPEMTKMMSGTIGIAVGTDSDVPFDQIIKEFTPSIPLAELEAAKQATMAAMRESMGFSENQLGEFSNFHGKTATETMQVAQAFSSRVDERKDCVGDVLRNIIRKWNQIIFRMWDTERVSKIVGPDGGQYWVKFTGDEIAGEYNYHVDVDSGMPVTRALRMEMANNLFDRYNGDPTIDQNRLRDIHLRNFYWVDPEVMLLKMGGMDPMQLQLTAAMRQSAPAGATGGMAGIMPGRGAGGGQTAQGPENPIPLENMAKRAGGK